MIVDIFQLRELMETPLLLNNLQTNMKRNLNCALSQTQLIIGMWRIIGHLNNYIDYTRIHHLKWEKIIMVRSSDFK